MSSFRWALIGYGDLAGKRVAAALQQARGCTLVGIWGRSPERARQFATKHQIATAYESLEDLVAADVDGVYVCTPPDSHAEYALRCLEADKHVLVEKPMASILSDCERMVALARRRRLVMAVAYYRRASLKNQAIKETIRSGFLGVPTRVNIQFHGWFNPGPTDPKHWRVESSRSGGAGALADIGVHRLDLLQYWLGSPRLVFAQLQNLVHHYEVEDSASLTMKLPNGAPVHAYFDWNSRCFQDRFEIIGTEGKLIVDSLDGTAFALQRPGWMEEKQFPVPPNVHLPCVEDFVTSVQEGREPLCNGEAGVETNRLLGEILAHA